MSAQSDLKDKIALAQTIVDAKMPGEDTHINIRIFLAKGGRFRVTRFFPEDPEHPYPERMDADIIQFGDQDQRFLIGGEWEDSSGKLIGRMPDYVGTLEGILGLLWELGEKGKWRVERDGKYFVCRSTNIYDGEYYSALYNSRFWADDLAGDFIGAAWLSVFEKEKADD